MYLYSKCDYVPKRIYEELSSAFRRAAIKITATSRLSFVEAADMPSRLTYSQGAIGGGSR